MPTSQQSGLTPDTRKWFSANQVLNIRQALLHFSWEAWIPIPLDHSKLESEVVVVLKVISFTCLYFGPVT